ncbi:13590_t:CDS:2 [Acaulospora colombiana]|uniref:13590_t:CDS:1 n=1 Tax=Acaulospora colombiana TaxID=27376 RepID=A0ACA9N958_9GLOM|nr:13590_t:CDS:2 [Acaulospora colombiana]
MSWSLETLDLRLEVEQEGLILEGAQWKDDHLAINDGESISIGRSQVRWVHIDQDGNSSPKGDQVNLPVYLNGDRNDVLFTVNLPFSTNEAALSVVRAVCMTAGGSPST